MLNPYPVIDAKKCTGDGLCVDVCSSAQFRVDKTSGKAVYVTGNRPCNGCCHCYAVCPHGAVTVVNAGDAALGSTAATAVRTVRDWLIPEAKLAGMLRMRRSVRNFRDQEVPDELLERVFDTIRYAPTGCNRQNVGWIVVRGTNDLKRLADAIAAWAADSPDFKLVADQYYSGVNTMLRDAPCAILAHGPSGLTGILDCAVALTYMELLLPSMGLGCCWSGLVAKTSVERPELLAYLHLPEGHSVLGGLMVGYPKYRFQRPALRKKAQVKWIG